MEGNIYLGIISNENFLFIACIKGSNADNLLRYSMRQWCYLRRNTIFFTANTK
jgi:hypothetical protein